MRIAVLIGYNPETNESKPITSGSPSEVRRVMKDIKLGKEKCKFPEVRYFDQYYQKINVANALKTKERREEALKPTKKKRAKKVFSDGENKIQE